MKIVKSTLFSALVLSTLSLGGCMTKEIVNHTFEFNVRDDSSGIEVLDYKYGDSKLPGVHTSDMHKKDTPIGGTGVSGPMLRGDFLYVKWRIKVTGEILEDTVDLRERLPRNIEGHRIHFVVKGRQLYVYLISPKPNPNRWVKPPLSMYSHLKVDEIYPAQPKF